MDTVVPRLVESRISRFTIPLNEHLLDLRYEFSDLLLETEISDLGHTVMLWRLKSLSGKIRRKILINFLLINIFSNLNVY
jgi:hypothetical protein